MASSGYWPRFGVSPPIEIQVGLVGAPVYHLRREVVVDHVAIAEKHVLIALPAVVVPETQTVVAVTIDGPVGVPGPVALDDLCGGLEGDAGVAVARTLGGRAQVARDVLDAKSVVGIRWPPLRQVAVAPGFPTGAIFPAAADKCLAVENVASVSGTGPHLNASGI